MSESTGAQVYEIAHFVDDSGEDRMGFLTAACACGWKCPPSPDEETRTDFLMQHAYEAGILTERSRRVSAETTSEWRHD